MKSLFLALLLWMQPMADPTWLTNMDTALQQAKSEHKFILLNFSGSDWCGPCIRMHKEVFSTEGFQQVAERKLVMVKADFPRMKKNQLPASQQKTNEALAERYNPNGTFPLTLLLDENGKVISAWEGFYSGGAAAFLAAIDQLTLKR